MPAYWSKKDERQYAHILTSCKRSRKVCKRIAAATVNKQRRVEGRGRGGRKGGLQEAFDEALQRRQAPEGERAR